ncbi:MAG: NUDIX domain-containing protein [Prevotella sp.]|nr:NUDIX domain-containing protein [Prevotella sp.]
MHPLDFFHYCPVCGSDKFLTNDAKSRRCTACGFVYYANAAASTAAFIIRNGQLLVARRAQEPARGTLDLPGGFVDMNETAEEGLHREMMEETGLEPVAVHYLFSLPNQYLYSGMVIHTLDLFFRVDIADDAIPIADDDAAELMWVSLANLHPDEFGLHSIRHAVEKFLAENS